MEPNTIECPKCSSTQLYFDKKGFSGKKAVVGAVLTGGVGLLAGTLGSNKILANCLSCGNKFSPEKPKAFASPAKNITLTPVTQKISAATIRKSGIKIAKVMSILIFSICIFILFIFSMSYFILDKSAEKSSAGTAIIILSLLTCFFGFLVKKSFKKPASIA